MQVANVSNHKNDWLFFPKTFVTSELPVDNGDITKSAELKQWKHLEHVTSQLSHSDDYSVGFIIRANYTKAFKPIETFQNRNDDSYAFKTKLGLCVNCPVNGNIKTMFRGKT